LRFIGDRSIQEKDFGRIQIDRVLEMQKQANINIFRNMLGLPEAKWDEKEEEQQQKHPSHDLKQRTLSDFRPTEESTRTMMSS
jgi:hypothetical protein